MILEKIFNEMCLMESISYRSKINYIKVSLLTFHNMCREDSEIHLTKKFLGIPIIIKEDEKLDKDYFIIL